MVVAGSLLLVGAMKDGAEAPQGGVVAGLLLTRALRRFACSGTRGHMRRGSCGRGARGRPGGGLLLAVPAWTSLGERESNIEREGQRDDRRRRTKGRRGTRPVLVASVVDDGIQGRHRLGRFEGDWPGNEIEEGCVERSDRSRGRGRPVGENSGWRC